MKKAHRTRVDGGVIETPNRLSRADKKRIRAIWRLEHIAPASSTQKGNQ